MKASTPPSGGWDVSWLWDVDFEMLVGKDGTQFSVSGIKAHNRVVRLKHAELPVRDVIPRPHFLRSSLLRPNHARVLYW